MNTRECPKCGRSDVPAWKNGQIKPSHLEVCGKLASPLILRVVVRAFDRDEKPATLPLLARETGYPLRTILPELAVLRDRGLVRYDDDDAAIYPTREGRAAVPPPITKSEDVMPAGFGVEREPESTAVPAPGGGVRVWSSLDGRAVGS